MQLYRSYRQGHSLQNFAFAVSDYLLGLCQRPRSRWKFDLPFSARCATLGDIFLRLARRLLRCCWWGLRWFTITFFFFILYPNNGLYLLDRAENTLISFLYFAASAAAISFFDYFSAIFSFVLFHFKIAGRFNRILLLRWLPPILELSNFGFRRDFVYYFFRCLRCFLWKLCSLFHCAANSLMAPRHLHA